MRNVGQARYGDSQQGWWWGGGKDENEFCLMDNIQSSSCGQYLQSWMLAWCDNISACFVLQRNACSGMQPCRSTACRGQCGAVGADDVGACEPHLSW